MLCNLAYDLLIMFGKDHFEARKDSLEVQCHSWEMVVVGCIWGIMIWVTNEIACDYCQSCGCGFSLHPKVTCTYKPDR
ncbi:hypothetical protein EXN66_Car020142 [Channa argus]|uniref:Uncharacterized protein n=1 Tax=Channa argus TaxID=215402 RepID=A0A6G1QQ82_CHAAH|nr:hypothetical protein EXN66_Car020142 [Channa argus]